MTSHDIASNQEL